MDIDSMCEKARNSPLQRVEARGMFSSSTHLWKYLKAVSENQDAKDLYLDISKNPFDASCADEIRKMLEKATIKSLFLPSRLEEKTLEKILTALLNAKSGMSLFAGSNELELLDLSENVLSTPLLDLLEQILRKKKVKKSLILNGCKCAPRSMKSANKLLAEIEKSKIAVEPANILLSWVNVPEDREQNNQEESLSSKGQFVESEETHLPSPEAHQSAESLDSGIAGSKLSVASVQPGQVTAFPEITKASQSLGQRTGLIAARRQDFESTQSVLLPSPIEPTKRLGHYRASQRSFSDPSLNVASSSKEKLNLRDSPQSIWNGPNPTSLSSNAKTEQPDVCKPITFSRPFSAEIGPFGGVIEFYDCRIIVEEGSFKKLTKIRGKLEIKPWRGISIGKRKPHVLISPMLYLESSHPPQKFVSIELTTWCISDGTGFGKGFNVDILHQPDGTSGWEIVQSSPLTRKNKFSLKTLHFSRFLIGIPPEFFGPQIFLLQGSLYADRDDNFTFLLHVKSSLLQEVLKVVFRTKDEFEMPGKKLLVFNELQVKLDDVVRVEISAEKLTFEKAGTGSLIVSRNFAEVTRWWKFLTSIDDDTKTPENGRLKLKYAIKHLTSNQWQTPALNAVEENRFNYTLRRGEEPEEIVSTTFYAKDHANIIFQGSLPWKMFILFVLLPSAIWYILKALLDRIVDIVNTM